MDERTWEVMSAFSQYLEEAVEVARGQQDSGAAKVAEVVGAHLGSDASQVPIVRFDVPKHQFVNLDIAVEALIAQHGGGELIGIGGGDQRHHQTLGDLLQRRGNWGMPVGPVDRARVETGPSSSREAVTSGIHLFRYLDTPVALFQRKGNPHYDSGTGVEVLASGDVVEALLSELRQLMLDLNVFRGQVLAFSSGDEMYSHSAGGIGFLERVEVDGDDVVLPDGALDRIERHVVGAGKHRDVLRAAGQHLKRGLLLYGPPGTGKTHTVRYLVGRVPGVTTIVLAGNALGAVSAATEMARALQPAFVVMEDIDLIAEHRGHHGPQPLLFTLLDAMDGLTSEADVAFLLTTNRPDLLEVALTQRPGRVDLAVEIPKPDLAARRALLTVYAGSLGLSDAAFDTAAERSAGATASFFKELIRRSVLNAAEDQVEFGDAVMLETLDVMLSEGETLTRALLGSGSDSLMLGHDEFDDTEGSHYTVLRGETPEYLRHPNL
jgi:ATPase family associated with various cellular activities (AAA)